MIEHRLIEIGCYMRTLPGSRDARALCNDPGSCRRLQHILRVSIGDPLGKVERIRLRK